MNGHIIYASKFSTDINAFQTIAENLNLSKQAFRVFIFLSCRVGSKYYCKIDKNQIANSLCISKKKVSDALDELEENLIIEHGSDDHTSNGYRMCYVDKLE